MPALEVFDPVRGWVVDLTVEMAAAPAEALGLGDAVKAVLRPVLNHVVEYGLAYVGYKVITTLTSAGVSKSAAVKAEKSVVSTLAKELTRRKSGTYDHKSYRAHARRLARGRVYYPYRRRRMYRR